MGLNINGDKEVINAEPLEEIDSLELRSTLAGVRAGHILREKGIVPTDNLHVVHQAFAENMKEARPDLDDVAISQLTSKFAKGYEKGIQGKGFGGRKAGNLGVSLDLEDKE